MHAHLDVLGTALVVGRRVDTIGLLRDSYLLISVAINKIIITTVQFNQLHLEITITRLLNK